MALAITSLRIIIVLIGIGALAFLLWEPHIEGRNINSTLYQIYFNDPFLIYVYIGSIAFFVGLYQAFKILGHIGRKNIFSQAILRALRIIKWCAIIIIFFVIGAEIFIMFNESDDRAGGVVIGILITFASIIVATASHLLEKILQKILTFKIS